MLQKYAVPAERRRFRDHPAGQPKKQELSFIRLVGFFVGGILLANLVLMMSAMFRGHAAHSTAAHDAAAPGWGPAAATRRAPPPPNATSGVATPDAPPMADPEPEPEAKPQERPAFASLCVDQARERLTNGLTYYYLQRGRRPDASVDVVSLTADMTVLFAGPADPALAAAQTTPPCAG